MDLAKTLHPKAHALRLARFDERKNDAVHYEAVTFPNGPRNGCWMYLTRAMLSGVDGAGNYLVDILDEEGDIIQDFPVSRQGARYLVRVLKLKVERDWQPTTTEVGAARSAT
jgi:hypothetical protein